MSFSSTENSPKVQWMWGDLVGDMLGKLFLGGIVGARSNPGRWSDPQPLEAVIAELDAQEEALRPVLLKIQNQQLKEFSSVALAQNHLRTLEVQLTRSTSNGSKRLTVTEKMTKRELEACLYQLLVPSDETGRYRPDRWRYLHNDKHYLHSRYKEAKACIEKDDREASRNLIERLEEEVRIEEQTLERAFGMFDTDHSDELNPEEIKRMNRYLGFPAEDDDVERMLKAACHTAETRKLKDSKADQKLLSYADFAEYVCMYGGTQRLFQQRLNRIRDKVGAAGDQGVIDEADEIEDLKLNLQLAGIDSDAQVYWKMVLPPNTKEFAEVAKFKTCHQEALATIRRLAKRNHEKALEKLQVRVRDLQMPDESLWLTLAWIRELAPILVHIDLDKMSKYLEDENYEDQRYKNQFETNTSGGLLRTDIRIKWEHDLFAGAYDNAEGKDRPKYGVQNVMNDHRGVVGCKQYGDSYLILKDVRLRCTFAPEDSANLLAEQLASVDYYAHVLNEYTDPELKETLQVATSQEAALLGDSEKIGKMKYKEAQIHGPIHYKHHVERLVAHNRHKDKGEEEKLRRICNMHGWEFSWMDDEKERMRKECMHKLGGAEWRARLEASDMEHDIKVPTGFCKMNCGRRVHPGTTPSGKPFKTCCRACAFGFGGHDRSCGRIDASMLGPGLCERGCGRPVATGKDRKGRPLRTCCKGCAMGGDHDATCQPAGYPSSFGYSHRR